MNASPLPFHTIDLPYFPLPAEKFGAIRDGLIQRNFAPQAIRDDHQFTAKNASGRLRISCAAFADDVHYDPDTSAVAVYYEPDNCFEDQVILDQMIFCGAPFVFIGRKDEVLPYGMNITGMSANGKPDPKSLGDALSYSEVPQFFERYQVDINPTRILAVKNGTAKFLAFPQLNPFQLRLFTLDITRSLLGENFSGAVNLLRQTIKIGQYLQLHARES